MYYRDHQQFVELKRQYQRERVQSEIENTERHIVEVNENLNNYIAACKDQLNVIDNTTITKYVYFNRTTDYHTNMVKYEVGVRCCPDVERPHLCEWTERNYSKVFGGREKKQAQEYAKQLAVETGYELRGAM